MSEWDLFFQINNDTEREEIKNFGGNKRGTYTSQI